MTPDMTPVTVTLPRWYVEQLSVKAEDETLGCETSIRWAEKHGTPDMLERIRANKARYEAVESAINTALDASEVTT